MIEQKATDAELRARAQHHPPTPERAAVHEQIRERWLEFATFLRDVMPASREAERALEDLDDAVMHANAAVARRWP